MRFLALPLLFIFIGLVQCKTWSPIYMYNLNYHLTIKGDRWGHWAGERDPDLRDKLRKNKNFPFQSATYEQIIQTFGKKYRSKETSKFPFVDKYKNEKFYTDQFVAYRSLGSDEPAGENRKENARIQTFLDLIFILHKGKVTKVFLQDVIVDYSKDIPQENLTGEFNFFPYDRKEPPSCFDYFFHTFTLGIRRGTNKLVGYQHGCAFDYDPEYWKDPIYQPIWDPKIMGTLEQLGIKEDHYR